MDVKRPRRDVSHGVQGWKARAIIAMNGVLVLLLIGTVGWVRRVNVEATGENDLLRQQIAAAEVKARELRAQATEALRDVAQTTGARISELENELEIRESAHAALLAARADSKRDAAAREKAARDDTLGLIEKRMTEMDARFGDRVKAVEAAMRRESDRFHSIQAEWDASTYLVHARFTYTTREEPGQDNQHVGTGWGTAFAIRKDGFLVTNKHVVQPWKFDPELCAMEALGEVVIHKDDVLLSAWQSGSRCMTKAKDPDLTIGYNTELGNLKIAATAPDSMSARSMEIGGSTLAYEVHSLDDNDLVLLKIDDTVRPVACERFDSGAVLAKLDRVMALGFPRGQRGLEGATAESSPSLGTVRKVESTIHITASIIPGNSGGPLFNRDGKVFGIATRVYSETLGICLKIDHALDLMRAFGPVESKPATGTKKPAAVASGHKK